MNTNLSKYLRAVSGLFFIISLFFGPSMAQAKIFQRITRSLGLTYVPQSKIDEVIDILGSSSSIGADYTLSRDLKRLALALDDPVSLIKASDINLFEGSGLNDAIIFFNRFSLYEDSNALFTKLFGSELDKIPFEEAEYKWINLLGSLKLVEGFGGRARVTQTDLEAAAISFIHRDQDLLPKDSLGKFFRDEFTVDHYINPHFTLSPHNPYYRSIMSHILPSLRDRKFSFPLDQELVARIWNDAIEEIRIYNEGSRDIPGVLAPFPDLFIHKTTKALIKSNSSGASVQSDPFLKAIMELAREDNRLAKVADILFSESGTDYTNVRINLERAIKEIFSN